MGEPSRRVSDYTPGGASGRQGAGRVLTRPASYGVTRRHGRVTVDEQTPGDPAFLTSPHQASAADLEPGGLFAGRYKLREKLGQGGMGIVFVADQQEPVKRRVALKVIKGERDSG